MWYYVDNILLDEVLVPLAWSSCRIFRLDDIFRDTWVGEQGVSVHLSALVDLLSSRDDPRPIFQIKILKCNILGPVKDDSWRIRSNAEIQKIVDTTNNTSAKPKRNIFAALVTRRNKEL